MGRDNLDALLAQQKCTFDKAGPSYTFDEKQKSFKNLFKFVKGSNTPFTTCRYCMHKGHSSMNCMIKKFGVRNGKYKWIPKGTKKVTYPKGPKVSQVPKTSL